MNFFGIIGGGINKFFNIFGINVTFSKIKNKYKWLEAYNIDTVVDIGANEGQFLGERLKILPGASFYSFEPLPQAFQRLKKKYGIRKQVTLYNVGLGDQEETKQIHESEFSPSSSFLEMTDIHKQTFPYTQNHHDIDVIIKKLDNMNIQGSNVLIKIDTQGYEAQVIEGGINTIKDAKICIIETSFCEIYKGQSLFSDIYKKMIDLGFIYSGNLDEYRDTLSGKMLFSDSIFIKN